MSRFNTAARSALFAGQYMWIVNARINVYQSATAPSTDDPAWVTLAYLAE